MFEEELPESDSSHEDFVPEGEKSHLSEEETDDQVEEQEDTADTNNKTAKKNNRKVMRSGEKVDETKNQHRLMMGVLSSNLEQVQSVLEHWSKVNFHLPKIVTEANLTDELVNLIRDLNDEESPMYVIPLSESGMLESLSDILASHSEYTPLHLAVRYSDIDIITLLLEKGADVNALNGDNETPLVNSYVNKNWPYLDFVKLFFEFGADITFQDGKSGHNVLHKAVIFYRFASSYWLTLDCFRWLVSKGVDVNSRTNSGQTCLHLAVMCESWVLVKELAGLGAKYLKDNNNQTPLHLNPVESFLMAIGIDKVNPNIRDKNGNTVLHLFAETRSLCPRSFLNDTFNFNLKDRAGSTVLHIIFKKDYLFTLPLFSNSITLILQHGADVNLTDNQGFTPYHYILKRPGDYLYRHKGTDLWSTDPEEMLILYLYKLHKVGLLVREKPCENMFDKDSFQEYDKKCDEEIDRMARRFVRESRLTFSMILTNNKLIIEENMKYPGLIKTLLEMGKEIYKEFPLYSLVLQNQIHKANLRLYYQRLQKIGVHILQQILPSMPSVVIYNLLKYFSEDEITDLNDSIKVSEGKQSEQKEID